MAVGISEISWGSPGKGGEITQDRYGIVVHTNCCGCSSEPLTDVDDLLKLRRGIDAILRHRGVRP